MATVISLKDRIPRFLKVLLYGMSDSGKTLVASGLDFKVKDGRPEVPMGTIVSDVLFCDVDGGLATITSLGAIMKYIFPQEGRFNTVEHLEALPNVVAQAKGIRLVSIDTLTRYQEGLMLPRIDTDEYKYKMQDWGYIKNIFTQLGSSCLDFNTHLICTAHVEEREDTSLPAIGQEYDQMAKKMKNKYPVRMVPALGGAFRNLIDGYFDLVGFLERTKVAIKGGGEQTAHVLHTRSTERWRARTRLNFLPDHIVNPTFPKILKLWEDGKANLVKGLREANPDVEIVEE